MVGGVVMGMNCSSRGELESQNCVIFFFFTCLFDFLIILEDYVIYYNILLFENLYEVI